MEEHTGYCVKCKKKNVKMVNPKVVKTKNNRRAAKGTCPKCGTKMMKFLPNLKK